MSRVYNFSAGPSMLPLDVLKKAQEEMLDMGGLGIHVKLFLSFFIIHCHC